MASTPAVLDSVVIGAGPAGIGTALALDAIEGLTHGVLERGAIGQTFLDWPADQTFLTPSFTGNGFGATDLNAIHPRTSPAYSLGVDYATGPQYARYLRSVVAAFDLPILTGADVTEVSHHAGVFQLETSVGALQARTVVWAGGEFGHPLVPRFAGSTFAIHSSRAEAWRNDRESTSAASIIVIGGYESGIDIACHHVERGAQVTVLDGAAPWNARGSSDASTRLAPRTRQRLASAQATGRLVLRDSHAVAIRAQGDGFRVRLNDGTTLACSQAPILATGFGPGLGAVAHLFAGRRDGWPALTDDDESTVTPGLFLSGPAVRHGSMKFCFVYKFRQRFAHIAGVIAQRLGYRTDGLAEWKSAGMLTDDLSCCGIECAC